MCSWFYCSTGPNKATVVWQVSYASTSGLQRAIQVNGFARVFFFYPRGGACRRPSDPWRALWCFPKAEYSGCLGAFVGTTSRDCGADDTGQRMSTSMRNVGTNPHKSTLFWKLS